MDELVGRMCAVEEGSMSSWGRSNGFCGLGFASAFLHMLREIPSAFRVVQMLTTGVLHLVFFPFVGRWSFPYT